MRVVIAATLWKNRLYLPRILVRCLIIARITLRRDGYPSLRRSTLHSFHKISLDLPDRENRAVHIRPDRRSSRFASVENESRTDDALRT